MDICPYFEQQFRNLKIKFSIGPGKTLVPGVSQAPDSQYIKSKFFYVSTSGNGIAPQATNGAPEKIENANVMSVIDNNLRSVIGLFNFENVESNGKTITTAAAQGISNDDQSLYSISIYKKEIWYNRETGKPMEQDVWTPVVLENASGTIRDFNIGNNRYYKYVF